MTRLIDPSPGELADRLTILSLKIRAAQERNVRFDHFETEHSECTSAFESHWRRHAPANDPQPQIDKLSEVNTKLWDLENLQRRYIAGPMFDFAAIARTAIKTTKLNDDRAELVQAINRAFNVDAPEKMY